MNGFGRVCVAAALLLGAACVDEGTDYELGSTLEVVGHFERTETTEDRDVWVGAETVTVVDRAGSMVCEEGWDLEAMSCPEACEPTLDVIRSSVRDLAEDCHIAYEVDTLDTRWPIYLTFEAIEYKQGLERGRVLVSEDPEGPWRPYAHAIFDEDSLTFHRTIALDVHRHDPRLPEDLEGLVRDPGEPPLVGER